MILTLSRTAFAGGLLALALLPLTSTLQTATGGQTAPATKPAAPKTAPDAAAPKTAPKAGAVAPADKAHAMAGVKVGEKAPDFTLKNLKDESVSLSKLLADKKQLVVLEWFNPDCPVSRAYHAADDSVMSKLAAAYAEKGVTWIAINSGAAGKEGSGKERNLKAVDELGVKYPVLLDENGAVGKLYGARTTPHMFVIDKDGVVRYAGAIDNGSAKAKGDTNYVKDALDALLAGKDVAVKEAHPFGCGVKYAE
jgi:peroxiredoxin